MTIRIAILGANGFIGTRTVEMFHLAGEMQVRPVVRSASSLAPLSKFQLDARVASIQDPSALQEAFEGCEVILHAIAGDAQAILGTLEPVYRIAQEAGVRRLVYLSSASVHGQAPTPGTDESSSLSDRQAIPYNNLRVRAERKLKRLHENGKVELVILRPGIVYGPRSRWISNFAEDLLSGKAYLIDRGAGICNSIYIDNLVHAIHLAAAVDGVDGQVFLVGDRERVAWSDLYRPVAEALGFDMDRVPEAGIPDFKPSWEDYARRLHASRPVQAFLSLFPMKARMAAYSALLAWRGSPPPSPWAQPVPGEPRASLEMSLLYRCQYKMPYEKAEKSLGYEPVVSFEEGCRRSVAWLAFAGYPAKTPTVEESPVIQYREQRAR